MRVDESFNDTDEWLCKCDDLEPLDFDIETRINGCLTDAVDKGYLMLV